MKKIFLVALIVLVSVPAFAELKSTKIINPDGTSTIVISGNSPQISEPEAAPQVLNIPAKKELQKSADAVIVKEAAVVKIINQTRWSVDVSFNIEVFNEGAAGDVWIELQGVDRDGFELVTHTIRGHVDAEQSKKLQSKGYFKSDMYFKVATWRVKDKRIY